MLLGASLAPTDPVLASDVQVGPPGKGLEDEVRFTLTAEAGLNDGLAFPFVNLALAMALAAHDQWFRDWLLIDVGWKLTIGVAIGFFTGRLLGWLIFHLPNRAKLSRTGDGFVALGVTCLSYGVTEMAHGYGFLAVFVAALGIRAAERNHSYHEKLHDFIEQLERLFMMALLVIFGGALVAGGLLQALNYEAVVFSLTAIFLVRPVIGWLSLLGNDRWLAEKLVISFFGIRGLGSVYYLAYGLKHGQFQNPDLLWSVIGFTILISVLLHGTSVTPVMSWLDRRAGRAGGSRRAGVRSTAQDKEPVAPHVSRRVPALRTRARVLHSLWTAKSARASASPASRVRRRGAQEHLFASMLRNFGIRVPSRLTRWTSDLERRRHAAAEEGEHAKRKGNVSCRGDGPTPQGCGSAGVQGPSITAGAIMPPDAARPGRMRRGQVERCPSMNSRLISSPTIRKKTGIRASFIQ